MKYSILLLIINMCLLRTAQGQQIDTLIYDFTNIQDITTLEDGTFIIIGEKRGAVKVSRINEKTKTLWTRTLTDSIFYDVREYEVRIQENDSSIQIITQKNECDIIPPGTAYLFTIDFNGKINDTVAIPFESGEPIFILSGIDSLPRCAFIKGDSVILRYAHEEDLIIDKQHELFQPRLVDMGPSGDIVVLYSIGSLRYYRLIGQEYTVIAGGYANPGAWEIIYAEKNHIILVQEKYISVIDTNGFEYNTFGNQNGFFHNVKWKTPYLYFKWYGLDVPDTFYATGIELNLVVKDIDNDSKHVDDIILNDSILFRVGNDFNFPYPNGFIESEDLANHILPKYYDVELVNYELGLADSFNFNKKCWQDHYLYYYPELVATIRNNGDYPVTEVTIGYEDNIGHCCTFLIWNNKITEMNLLPGETRNFIVPDFYVARFYPFYVPFNKCIHLSAPDNHPDDFYENNDACLQGLPTDVEETISSTEIQFYPNPASGTVYFNLPENEKLVITIYDVNGQTILKEKIHDSTTGIDLQEISSGIYFIKTISSTGEISTDKLIRL